jgi:hypothetical protein
MGITKPEITEIISKIAILQDIEISEDEVKLAQVTTTLDYNNLDGRLPIPSGKITAGSNVVVRVQVSDLDGIVTFDEAIVRNFDNYESDENWEVLGVATIGFNRSPKTAVV